MKFRDIIVDYSSPDCNVDFLVKTAERISEIKKETGADPMLIQLEHLKSLGKDIEAVKWFFNHDFGAYCSLGAK
jgi:hypothetical protein